MGDRSHARVGTGPALLYTFSSSTIRICSQHAMVTRKLDIGDRAPDFDLPDIMGDGRCFYNEIVGWPIVLIFFEAGSRVEQVRQMSALHRTLATIRNVQLFGIFVDEIETLAGAAPEAVGDGPIILVDLKGRITEAYAAMLNRSGRFALVLDPNQRILAIPGPRDLFGEIERIVKEMTPPAPPRQIDSIAPVLVVPNLIDRDFCERLIRAWKSGKKGEGLTYRIEGNTRANTRNPQTKRRTDHFISDPHLAAELAGTLGPRLLAEVRKAFFFEQFQFEQFRIGRYHWEDRGFFKAHRDFIGTSHENRRFAVSLNLNAESYVGGDLRFPEYGPELYRPPTGAAIVFSGSLMHEVLPVTEGERFVMLTFLLATKAP